ncbi:aquaporin [Microbacterium sp. APC 3898]|uniref:Aquaporin n=1 Tax=Planococcus notacanthi TaxID=3035188 RepID=A0ABT7ZNF1_9BACL|nr:MULTISPECIES: aquaporin [Terrabacteria group]MDN3428665.1 aquaporin [Planococcus sp. APC 4016]MDN3498627.1 aquaporin [Microbacterium sp. APC 3898]
MKKYLAEFIGTFILVFLGTGAAVVLGGYTGGTDTGFLGVLAIAFAFGLSIVAGAYAIGHISGCHVNPAVSLAVLISGNMTAKEFGGYVVAQILGAFAGSSILAFVVASSTSLEGFGANGYGELSAVGLNLTGALVIEVILTFIFVLAILGVTTSKATSHMGGIVIGLTLTLVHIIGIPLTGTSVNPARSLAPAIFAGGDALAQLWVFIVAPLVGAALAAFVFKSFFVVKDETGIEIAGESDMSTTRK